MRKIVFLLLSMIVAIMVGCGNVTTSIHQDNHQINTNSKYKNILRKTWIMNKKVLAALDGEYMRIRVDHIDDTGTIEGWILVEFDEYDGPTESTFMGTITNDQVDCQIENSSESINLNFSEEGRILVTASFITKSVMRKNGYIASNYENIPFEADNIKNYNYNVIDDKSMYVDLNSWGNVRFTVAELLGGNYGPVLTLLLTNEEGDELYDFFRENVCDLSSQLLYATEVDAVSFEDVNLDGLKDFVIIADVKEGSKKIASVYLQKSGGDFIQDYELEKNMNNSLENKNIENAVNFLKDFFADK